jgi:transposase
MARRKELADFFARPQSTTHRRYEVCRAYFLEHQTARKIAPRLGLAVNTVQGMVRDFADNEQKRVFFVETPKGRRPRPAMDQARRRIRQLRQDGLALGEIVHRLAQEGCPVSAPHVSRQLRADGFPGFRGRRRATPPGEQARDGSEVPAVADVAALDLSPERVVPTQVAGLFLFMPDLLALHVDQAIGRAGYPGSKMIPPTQAILALLAGRLLGKRRISHIDDLNCDAGAGLFAGLNVLPKTTYATDYSYTTQRNMNEELIDALIARFPGGDRRRRKDFYLDFHAIPYRGEEAELDQHWVPMRNKAKPSVMAFVAQEAERRIVCYATANVVRKEADTMAVRFVDHWKETSGHCPARVILDSRVTVYAGLSELNQRRVGFITVRKRGAAMLRRVAATPARAWQRCQVIQAGTRRRDVQYLDEIVELPEYEGEVRQLVVKGLGREKPTFLLTNDLPEPLPARQVIMDYAARNRVEHNLGEKITFFHMDCLASEVRLNVDFDLTLTVCAHLLYQCFARRLKGFETATPASLYRKFINTPGRVEIAQRELNLIFDKRSHNPILVEAGLQRPTPPIPWCGGFRLRMIFP